MARVFDLHGLTSLSIDDDRERVLRYVDAQLDPYQPTAGVDPEMTDVVLCPNNGIVPGSLCDVHGPAGDNRRTCVVDGRCYLMRRDSLFELPRLSTQIEPVRLSYDRTFPLWIAFSELVRPLLQLATINRGAVVVHGAAVQLRGGGLVICGWSETGKTETALALAEAGARFISDKWTVIDRDARIHSFPISVGIRDWVLDYLPLLRAHLRTAQRARLRASRTARRGLPLLIRPGANPLAAVAESQLERALALTGRLSLSQSEVAAVYGSPQDTAATPPLVTLAMLTTVPGEEVTVREAEVGWVARRLAQSGVYERRSLYELDARVRYAFAQSGSSPLLGVADREADLLRNLLAGVRLLEVKAPFPTDPRKVADALARWC